MICSSLPEYKCTGARIFPALKISAISSSNAISSSLVMKSPICLCAKTVEMLIRRDPLVRSCFFSAQATRGHAFTLCRLNQSVGLIQHHPAARILEPEGHVDQMGQTASHLLLQFRLDRQQQEA